MDMSREIIEIVEKAVDLSTGRHGNLLMGKCFLILEGETMQKMIQAIRWFGMTLTALCALAGGLAFAAPPVPVQRSAGGDPGAQLRQMEEQRERARVEREMEARRKEDEAAIDDKQEKPTEQTGAVRFTLQGVEVDKSAVMPPDVREGIVAPHIGKEVSVEDLYAIVGKLNTWYRENGYITCRAYLPPQTIHAGIVHIALVEGRTGNIEVKNNKYTNTDYITDKIGLEKDEIANIKTLDERVTWFNETNDVFLHLTLRAGKEPGTTDYELSVREPQNQVTTLYYDGAGNETTGRWRSGVFYTNRSVSGTRDALSLGYLHAQGLESFSASYSIPVSKRGTRLGFEYSTNATNVIDGLYREWGMEAYGHAYAAAISLRHPIRANRAGRTELSFSFGRQHSATELMSLNIVNDTFTEGTAAIAFTHYGPRRAFYHRYAYTSGRWENNSMMAGFQPSEDYGFFAGNWLYQQGVGDGQLLSIRANAQMSERDNLRASKQFFLGGAYSVRGYKENAIGADNGYCFGVEYAVPLLKDKSLSLYGFFDYGGLWGENRPERYILAGTGAGLRAKIAKILSVDVAVGFPLRRELDEGKVDKARVHLTATAAF